MQLKKSLLFMALLLSMAPINALKKYPASMRTFILKHGSRGSIIDIFQKPRSDKFKKFAVNRSKQPKPIMSDTNQQLVVAVACLCLLAAQIDIGANNDLHSPKIVALPTSSTIPTDDSAYYTESPFDLYRNQECFQDEDSALQWRAPAAYEY